MRWLISRRLILACCCFIVAVGSKASAGEPASRPTTAPPATSPTNILRAERESVHPTPPGAASPSREVPPHRTASPVFPRPGIPSPSFTQPVVQPEVTNQTRQALDFYGGYAARATLSQLPRRTPIESGAPQPMYRQIKPFNAIYHEPTVSPYLNLYRADDDSEGAPNYYAFVRPQLEQIEANRMQQREIQKLRGQLQGMATPGAGPGYQPNATRGSRAPARYMDTAQFYSGWRR